MTSIPGRWWRGVRLSLLLSAVSCGESATTAVDPPSAPPLPAAPQVAPSPPPADTGAPTACPQGMARIEGFCVDRHEAHLVTRGPGGELLRHPYHQRPVEGVAYEARSEAGAFPQAYINRLESQAACAGAGKRLCTMAEWQRACRGSRGTTYPYGDRAEAGRCNMEKPHLLTLRLGPDPRRWRYQDFNDPALDQEPGFLSRAGAHPACVSEEGVSDLVGNVHEWVSDTVDGALMGRLAAEGVWRNYQPWARGNGVFMGGFFSTRVEHGPGCRFTTVAHEPRYHDYTTGFRCCADAPEGSPG
jgi:formylglycine-generating enzyme required for sulfatase activity